MIKVESHIPPPLGRRSRIYPLDKLEVGQSFFVPSGNRNSISASASKFGKTYGGKFRVTQDAAGVRVWRVA